MINGRITYWTWIIRIVKICENEERISIIPKWRLMYDLFVICFLTQWKAKSVTWTIYNFSLEY